MLLTGSAGLGLVWGWLLGLCIMRGGWRLRAVSWLSLTVAVALQGAAIVWVATPEALISFGVALPAALSIHLFWAAGLARGARPIHRQGDST